MGLQGQAANMEHLHSDISEDELAAISEEDFPIERRSKRRRLDSASSSHVETHSSCERRLSNQSNTTPSACSAHGSQNSKDPETPQEKPKSKYRIHIPKHGDLPKDSFFTQPPQRSSSPYRIEPFFWQKPTDTSPVVKKSQRSISNPSSPTRKEVPTTAGSSGAFVHSSHGTSNTSSAPIQELGMETKPVEAENYDDILADIPSDAFSSPERPSVEDMPPNQYSVSQTQQRLRAPQANLRQTTLFGQPTIEIFSSSQSAKKHNWPLASREEPPTHHELDHKALETWVYPTNLGSIRDYQYSIVAKGLYHNLLVALPTGLGKTFIAATVMLNWYRWTTKSQLIFVAPTRPLVSQQVKACFEIAGIPRASTVMLTGNTQPGIRAEEWLKKRVFFMTPQTLINDLKSGMCDPKNVVLLVVDEAHRATGNYAYVEVVKFLKRFNTSFRVLALTATPGASIETVQQVIDGLGISRIEIRTEDSLDIRQYVHSRKIDTVLFENSDEMAMIMDLFSKAQKPVLDKLNRMNAYWMKDPMMLTPYGCNQARGAWMQSDAGRKANFGVKGMVNTIFSLLASLSHGTELLKYHGVGPFFQKMLAFRTETQACGEKGSKYKKEIVESEFFVSMMTRVQSWINNPDFVGHPKLEYLQSVVMNHFLDAGDGRGATDPSRTRIMIFAHYRDSAEEIARVLKRNEPMIRPHVFVGQANSKNSEGMDQATQLDVIKRFQDGIYNTLVATSIGEEGLDIGQVDLIVCYDASASPIRMLQRMGRTGRKRAGNIVVTLMTGKEENNFIKAKDNYEKMQSEIAAGTRFAFHDESSRRIVPKTIQPVVDKRIIDIPPENTQPDLPEPSKRAKAPKKPAKKFNMPDNVRIGFVKASRIDGTSDDESMGDASMMPQKRAEILLEPIPDLQDVLLSASEKKTLEHNYLDVKGDTDQIVAVPKLNAFPSLQRGLRPVQTIKHGHFSRRIVRMLNGMQDSANVDRYKRNLQPKDRAAGIAQAAKRSAFFNDAPRIQNEDTTLTMDSQKRSEFNISSTFLPPASARSRDSFDMSPESTHNMTSDSGEELPEFATLKARTEPSELEVESARVGCMQRRKKGRRRVLDSDSDE